ncbi:MAG: peroxiredoxin [Candidatus Manganitrophus sp.]|nr:peroxiredoxin [Candidatus Manganitrophus sp.]
MEKHLAEGVPAPDFSLPAHDGRTIRLSDYKGKNHVILYFYPKDDTPGCTKEACAFRNDYNKFKPFGVEILGVSTDPIASHQAFALKVRSQLPASGRREKRGRPALWGAQS